MSRQNRKKEHIEYALKTAPLSVANGFTDLHLVYEALPGLDLDEVDITLYFLNKKLKAPLLINAMTGGHPEVKQINRSLARCAARTGIAMAVGSQTAGLENPAVRDTYAVARDENPGGVLLANLSALATPDMASEAVAMIKADGIQLHLNVAQELAMAEGDRNFSNTMANIEKIVRQSPVPVVVKEVGFGLSRETIKKIHAAGVKYIDLGGKGGTDFYRIERMRAGQKDEDRLSNIGITTACSLLEALSLNLPLSITASGGFTGRIDVACALALGAELVGMAGHFLQVLSERSEQGLIDHIEDIKADLQKTMLMTGAGNLKELTARPVIITGFTAEWLRRRGVAISGYARR